MMFDRTACTPWFKLGLSVLAFAVSLLLSGWLLPADAPTVPSVVSSLPGP